MSIGIPVDSRIRKIYELWNSKSLSDKQIYDYFHGLAHKYGIPPLHLDSLLWVKR
jgi:N-glycosylase/DNA lyase